VINIFPKSFGAKIRTLRKEAGLKQAELGLAVGLSHDTISGIERGKALTNMETLITLAQYFHVSVDWLLELSEDKEIQNPSGQRSANKNDAI